MCTSRDVSFETTVGELQQGARFRDPDGNTLLIAEGGLIVNIDSGATAATGNWIGDRYCKDVKLGRDHAGRLYAARKLNGWRHGTNPLARNPVNLMEDNNPSSIEDEQVDISDTPW